MFVQSTSQWRNWRFEQEENLAERPTGLCRWPASQHSEKKTLETMKNPGVDGFSKNQNQRKISETCKKMTTYWKPKEY